MDAVRRSLSFVVCAAGVLSITVITVLASVRFANADDAHFAFVYLNDTDSANSFKELLEENGLAVELMTLADAPKTDFASYTAVIAGNDVKKAWDSAVAKQISDSKRPVLGLGEGGAHLFERWNLAIGWPHAWQGADVAVKAMRNGSNFWSSAKFTLPNDGEVVLYAESNHAGIYLPKPLTGVVGIGRELGNPTHYPIIEQNRRYLLWGFGGSPRQMTPLGKQVFVHACRYVAQAAKADDSTTQSTADVLLPSLTLTVEHQVANLQHSPQTIRVEGMGGTLAIKVAGPQIETVVADQVVTLHDRAADRSYVLKIVGTESPRAAPTIEVAEAPSGVHFRASSFQIKRGNAAVVTASFEVPASAPTAVPETKETASASPSSATEYTLFLSCGSAGGPGKIHQLTATGKNISILPLDQTAYGLVRRGDALIAAMPSVRRGGGKLLVIHVDGKVEPLEVKANLGAPIGLALDHETQDVLVSDNEQHTVLRLMSPQLDESELLFRAPLTAAFDHFPSMSVAGTKDRHVVFSAFDPKGVFRFPLKSGADLPEPLLPGEAAVAADPTSNQWVAMFDNQLKVFEEQDVQRSIPCADDVVFWHYRVMAFAPDGKLFVVLDTGDGLEVQSVDLRSGKFSPQFAWKGVKIISMAVGARMNWR